VNLLIVLGAAAGSEDFRELLFKNPTQAAQSLRLVLTLYEVEVLESIFSPKHMTREKRDDLRGHLEAIRAEICKKPPCPFSVAIPNPKDLVSAKPAA
jgi:hypothetical protein